jgi:hypothetical protein
MQSFFFSEIGSDPHPHPPPGRGGRRKWLESLPLLNTCAVLGNGFGWDRGPRGVRLRRGWISGLVAIPVPPQNKVATSKDYYLFLFVAFGLA